MTRPDLTSLRMFLTVYRLGNIAKAAVDESIAASAISKRIQALEAEVGAPLFYRHLRGMSPTPAGETLARHAQVLFENLNRMTSDMSSFASGLCGQVLVYAHTSAVIQYLPPQIAAFNLRFPGVKVILREARSMAVLRSVCDGDADIGIVASNIATPPNVAVLPYRRDRLVALVPASHSLADRDRIGLCDLRDVDHVSLATGSSLQALLADAAQAAGFVLKTRIEVQTFESAIRMVDAGLGVAVLPEGVLAQAQARPGTCAVPLWDEWADRLHVLCVRNGRTLTAAAARMLDHLCAGEPQGESAPPSPARTAGRSHAPGPASRRSPISAGRTALPGQA